MIAAKLIPSCKITVGKQGKDWPYSGTIEAVRNMGAEPIQKDVNEVQVDSQLNLVTTPAFMKNATYYEVFDGIGRMIDEIFRLCK